MAIARARCSLRGRARAVQRDKQTHVRDWIEKRDVRPHGAGRLLVLFRSFSALGAMGDWHVDSDGEDGA